MPCFSIVLRLQKARKVSSEKRGGAEDRLRKMLESNSRVKIVKT